MTRKGQNSGYPNFLENRHVLHLVALEPGGPGCLIVSPGRLDSVERRAGSPQPRREVSAVELFVAVPER